MDAADPSLLRATRRLLVATSSVSGEAFYRNLAAATAEVLGVRWALIGELDGSGHIATRALWDTDRIVANVRYDLDGSPCQHSLDTGACYVPSDLQAHYPRHAMAAALGAVSYAGLRLPGSGGASIGVLAALHDQPTAADLQVATILELFAGRAALELEREHAEVQLRTSEARYRQIVTTCGEGVWTIDAAGITTFVNQRMATMLGYSADEMVGQPMYRFMADDDRRSAETNLARRAAGIRERHEFRFRHQNGTDVWTSLATNPLYDDGSTYVGALALVTDLTERRVLDRRVQQALKLESLSLVAGGVAHDFNNLLVGILGNIELVARTEPPDWPHHGALHDVVSAATRASELIRQLLVAAGKSQPVFEPVAINSLLTETQRLLQAAVARPVRVRLVLTANLPPASADPTQLRQVVMTLLTNASDAIGGGPGTITLATSVVHADRAYLSTAWVDDQLPEGDYVAIEVADTGVGMDATTRARAFEPFFTTKATGHGLGLAAALGILRSHRGAVRVTSEPGKGSTFTVLLPIAAALPAQPVLVVAPAPQPAAPRPRPLLVPRRDANGARGKILIIDDEAGVRSAARRTLQSLGYRVILAADGQEGIDAFAANRDVCAVVLDLTLPSMSGAEVFGALRELDPAVRIVLSSGYDRDDVAARVGARMTAFLQKPWTIDQLLAVIETAAGDA